MDVSVRRASTQDVEAIAGLVDAVVREVYGHLFADMPPPDGDWDRSWVAESARGLIGVGLCRASWIDDLWVLPDCRSVGVGSALLLALETEIAERGHDRAGLRVVAENHSARRFYAAHGWREIKTYRHERWGFAMVDMEKPLNRSNRRG